MSWIVKLAETYDNCRAEIGYSGEPNRRPLIPICHITSQAHIEVVIDEEGNFRRARVITDKAEAATILPTTEASAGRSGQKPECHPLCDKLQYLAGDFVKHGGVVTSGFSKDPEEPFRNYLKTLTGWCESEFSHPKIRAVLKYVSKRSLIEDLARHRVLYLGSDGKFLSKEQVEREKNARDIFSVVDPQENAFVRWLVEGKDPESRVWRDESLWESWSNYYLSRKEEKAFCLVAGEERAVTYNHPKYIRREGDGAKLISANDARGFTYRGRFTSDAQACSVGLEASQKAHYALAWLISRQGYKKNDLAIVAWATSGAPVPQPTDGSLSLWGEVPTEEPRFADTAQEAALQLKKRIAGYGKALKKTDRIVVLALDSATPGRMAITYYRDLEGSSFLEKIDRWHTTCAWLHHYGEIYDPQTGKTRKNIRFFGAPAPDDIAEAAYGSRLDEKLRQATVSRLLPCIVDGLPIPRDLVESTVRRASNRIGLRNPDDQRFRGEEEYTWKKTLSIACALFKKYQQDKETYPMPLDENRTSRDYLFGRLLAVADILEERALYKAGEKRATNAARYMQQFSQRPFRTWNQIHSALTPYIVRLGGAFYYKNLIAEIKSLFSPEDFTSDRPLSGEYLLGYYCQRQKLLEKSTPDSAEPEAEVQELQAEA